MYHLYLPRAIIDLEDHGNSGFLRFLQPARPRESRGKLWYHQSLLLPGQSSKQSHRTGICHLLAA